VKLDDELKGLIRANDGLMRVLRLARELDLPDWRVVSGAVYQTVWNDRTGRPLEYGLKDYDLAYFDADPSWAAEDRVIRRAAALFPPPLDALVEVRNQGRVHLWFESKFGEAYAPLADVDEMLERFVCPAFAIGVRLERDDRLDIAAPFGLEDCFAMRLRPNPRRPASGEAFARVVASARARWPEVVVDDGSAA
jgi:uncharacterized protein